MDMVSVYVFHRFLGRKIKCSEQSMYFTDLSGGRLNALSSLLQLHLLGGEVCVFESEVMANFRAFHKLSKEILSETGPLCWPFQPYNIFEAVTILRIFKPTFQNVSFASLVCMA